MSDWADVEIKFLGLTVPNPLNRHVTPSQLAPLHRVHIALLTHTTADTLALSLSVHATTCTCCKHDRGCASFTDVTLAWQLAH